MFTFPARGRSHKGRRLFLVYKPNCVGTVSTLKGSTSGVQRNLNTSICIQAVRIYSLAECGLCFSFRRLFFFVCVSLVGCRFSPFPAARFVSIYLQRFCPFLFSHLRHFRLFAIRCCAGVRSLLPAFEFSLVFLSSAVLSCRGFRAPSKGKTPSVHASPHAIRGDRNLPTFLHLDCLFLA